MDWQDLGVALALMMVFEGISPFLMPNRMRRLAALILTSNDNNIRLIGLVSMASGLGLLYLLRLS